MIDNGPVLILSFTAQQILYVTNSEGRVIEGDKVNYHLNTKYIIADILANYILKIP